MASTQATPADGRPVLVIAGPTASGKSRLALRAAQEFDGVVINADSMQVYRKLRILTARPPPEDEAAAPHRLYGWLDPADVCSAVRWREAALAEIRAAGAAGRLPIVVGGSGFYIEALMRGLPAAPPIPEAIRAEARAEAAADPAGVHARLAVADPETAARINPADPQRLARALEVWRAAGAPPSAALGGAATPPEGLRFHVVALAPERGALYRRIDARAAEMAEAGAAAEAAAFMALGLPPELPAAKAVGLREFAAAAVDERLLPDAVAATAQASRRYAKRQTTWLRNRLVADRNIDEQVNSNNVDHFIRELRSFSLTGR